VRTVSCKAAAFFAHSCQSLQTLHDELFPQSVKFNGELLSALTPVKLESLESTLGKLTEAAKRIAATKPVPEKADRRHGGALNLRAG
jgi:hypothetical protein